MGTALDRIAAALASEAGGQHRPIALGWATVELDRAAAELAAELGVDARAFLPAADSVVLGARCRVAYGVLTGGAPLAILEPSTEGRLAGALARHGEGPTVTWARSESPRRGRPPTLRPGPFGPERLDPVAPTYGPFLLLVEGDPGTIHA
jgi:hypothetical protein